jgi:ABC-type multidrug transport system fused ATPase/permease subunit
VLAAISAGILAFALLRGFLTGWYTIALAELLQGRIVVDLRAKVYDKLQRLSFRFFESSTTCIAGGLRKAPPRGPSTSWKAPLGPMFQAPTGA